MQLKANELKALLTTASCALLGTTQVHASETDTTFLNEWDIDTAIMYYSEADRVTAVEGIIAGQKTFDNDEVLNVKVTLDSLTGASANGAVAQPNVQTFTRPSGKGQYQVKPGDTPLDDTFKDTRLQLTGQWTQPISEDLLWSIGGNMSKEYDYLSLSMNSNVAKDFYNKNTTLSAGFAFAFDKIEPEGGIPRPLASMPINESDGIFDLAFEESRIAASDEKTTGDLLFGLTQVINRRMIVQLNYSFSTVNGYMTDPFKVVSVVNTEGYTQDYLYESRPEDRTKHAFFGQAKYHFTQHILDASYRYMTDDWDIDSHTIDMHYTIPLTKDTYIEPHIRYYRQSAANFYQPFIIEGQMPNEYVSADYRIGKLDAMTLGIKYSAPLDQGNRLSMRLEYYQQSPKSDGTQAVGVLKEVELYEKVKAVIAQVTYSF